MSIAFKPVLKYILLKMKHKWFVFQAGLKTKAPLWRLVIHDWSKFTFAEAPYYARQCYGDKGDFIGFMRALNHHLKSNPHHWEYWVIVSGHGDYPDGAALPMPERFIREMVADWMGATRTHTGSWPKSLNEWVWWQNNFEKINLHIETRERVLQIVEELFKSQLP